MTGPRGAAHAMGIPCQMLFRAHPWTAVSYVDKEAHYVILSVGAFHDRSPRHVHHDPFDLANILHPGFIYVPNVNSVIFRFEGHTGHTI